METAGIRKASKPLAWSCSGTRLQRWHRPKFLGLSCTRRIFDALLPVSCGLIETLGISVWGQRNGYVIRYGLAALLIVVAIILVIPPFAASLIEQWSQSDVESRSVLAFNSAIDDLTALLAAHDSRKITALFDRMALDEELLAIGYCDAGGSLAYKTKEIPKDFTCKQVTLRKTPAFSTLRLGRLRLLVSSFPVTSQAEPGHLVLLHDLALVQQRGEQARFWTIAILIGVVFLAAAFAVLVTVLLARRWLHSLRRAIDDVRLGGSGAIEFLRSPAVREGIPSSAARLAAHRSGSRRPRYRLVAGHAAPGADAEAAGG